MSDWVAENEDVTQRFVNAVLEGIAYADANRDGALDIVMKYAPDEDPAHQQYMLETELDMALPAPIGMQTEEQWQKLHDFLVQYGALSRPIDDISTVFTDRFIKAITLGARELRRVDPERGALCQNGACGRSWQCTWRGSRSWLGWGWRGGVLLYRAYGPDNPARRQRTTSRFLSWRSSTSESGSIRSATCSTGAPAGKRALRSISVW
jgi:hypothetical protein